MKLALLQLVKVCLDYKVAKLFPELLILMKVEFEFIEFRRVPTHL